MKYFYWNDAKNAKLRTSAALQQLRAVWGPFVGEAGTFELRANDVITMQATVAKNPSTMTKGGVSVFNYQRTLTLTQVRTPAGPNSNPGHDHAHPRGVSDDNTEIR